MIERITSDYIYDINDNEIFVFGSNLSGIHGAGCAKTAMRWGAIYGNPSGLQGKTYAIPTKDALVRRTLKISEIKPYVDEFLNFAEQHPNLIFLVTEIGCGLAGIHPQSIAPLFKRAIDIPNIHLSKRFWIYII
jgi:hypothetical protein